MKVSKLIPKSGVVRGAVSAFSFIAVSDVVFNLQRYEVLILINKILTEWELFLEFLQKNISKIITIDVSYLTINLLIILSFSIIPFYYFTMMRVISILNKEVGFSYASAIWFINAVFICGLTAQAIEFSLDSHYGKKALVYSVGGALYGEDSEKCKRASEYRACAIQYVRKARIDIIKIKKYISENTLLDDRDRNEANEKITILEKEVSELEISIQSINENILEISNALSEAVMLLLSTSLLYNIIHNRQYRYGVMFIVGFFGLLQVLYIMQSLNHKFHEFLNEH